MPTCPLSTYYAANLNLLHKSVAYILHILGIIPPKSRLRLVGTEVYFMFDVSDPIQYERHHRMDCFQSSYAAVHIKITNKQVGLIDIPE